MPSNQLNANHSHRSLAFGLHLATNILVPGLVPVPLAEDPDLVITLESLPDLPPNWIELDLYPDDETRRDPNLHVFRHESGGHYRLLYRDGTEFILSSDGRDIWTTWTAPSSLEDTATYLLGPVIGFALRLRGTTSLHASAVQINSRLAVFTGSAGAGKSSICATFALRRFPVTGDDVLPITEHDGVFTACAAYPRVRLWADSAAALCGSAESLPLLTPTWDKRFLPIDEGDRHLVAGDLPIGCIYLLAGHIGGEVTKFEPLSAREALISLVANTYANYLLTPDLRAAEFQFLSALVAKVPVFNITVPAGLHLLPLVCEQIALHFAGAQKT